MSADALDIVALVADVWKSNKTPTAKINAVLQGLSSTVSIASAANITKTSPWTSVAAIDVGFLAFGTGVANFADDANSGAGPLTYSADTAEVLGDILQVIGGITTLAGGLAGGVGKPIQTLGTLATGWGLAYPVDSHTH